MSPSRSRPNDDPGGCDGSQVLDNAFDAATSNGGADANFSCTGSDSTDVTVSGNSTTGDSGGSSFTSFSGVDGGITVTDNTGTTDGSSVFFFGNVSGSAVIDGNTFSGGTGSAVSIHGADITSDTANTGTFDITDNTFTDNVTGVSVAASALAPGAQVAVHGNNVAGNSSAVVENASPVAVDASGNWWGAASGPGSVGSGSGSNVSSGIDFSNWCVTTTCPSVPAVATNVVATVPASGVAQAQVSWTAPATDGGSSLTGYVVTPYDQTASAAASPVTTGTSTTVTVPGLVVGDSYTVTVTAINGVGSSPASSPSNSIVTVGAPQATSSNSGSTVPLSGTASAGTIANPSVPGGSISASAQGVPGSDSTLATATYATDPLAGLAAGNAYYDVSVSPGSQFSSITFVVCGVPAGNVIQWWDPVGKVLTAASDQTPVAGQSGCISVTVTDATTPTIAQLTGTVFVVATPPPGGYTMAAADGGVFTFGDATFAGSLPSLGIGSTSVVGMASTPDHQGYWLAASDGAVYAFGDATFYGSMGGQKLNQPIVGIAAGVNGGGYYEVAGDGGVFAFGGAPFLGSMGGTPLNAPVVGIDAVSGGYYEVATDGGVFAFGKAAFFGSTGAIHLDEPIVGMA